MGTMRLNLSVKELDQGVKYVNPYKEIKLKREDSDFLFHIPIEEVKNLSKKDKKKLIPICISIATMSISTFMLGSPVLAATTAQQAILPSDVVEIGLKLIGIAMVASTVLAVILFQLAGGLRMLRKGKEATEWTTDILKGYTQVLLAPVIIITLAITAYLLFGGFAWFSKPF